MDKTIWNSNLFFQIIELIAVILFFMFAKHIGWWITTAILFYIHLVIYAVYGLSTATPETEYKALSSQIGLLKTYIWFFYVLTPFLAFHDTYFYAYDRKPLLFKKELYKKKKIVIQVVVNKEAITIKQEKNGWTLFIDDDLGSLIVINDNDNEQKNKTFLKALKIAMKENLLNYEKK